MKSIITLSVSAALFSAMFYAPAFTILAVLALVVLSDICRAVEPATTVTRADDKEAWDAIFEEPEAIEEEPDMPTDKEYNDMFAIEEEPIVLTYQEVQAEVKARYTKSQRKKLGIKLNAKQAVLEAWL